MGSYSEIDKDNIMEPKFEELSKADRQAFEAQIEQIWWQIASCYRKTRQGVVKHNDFVLPVADASKICPYTSVILNMETYTTDEALALMGFGKFQAFVLVYAGIGWVADSMQIMLLSFVGPLVRKEWKISASDESLLSSVVFAGMIAGACAWGFVSDKYGRRTTLLFSTLFTSGVGFVSAFSSNYLCLLALRFLVGVGVGGSHVFLSWFLEFVPAYNRGIWMALFSSFWTIGTVMEASLAWVVIPALSWRWLLALTAVPCFLLILFFRLTPESPRFLCAQNRISDAMLILERIATANKSALPSGVLTYHPQTNIDHNSITSEIEHLPVKEKKCWVDNVISSKPGGSIAALRMLLSHKLLRLTLLLWFVYYANSFAYYGLVLLTSQLSEANKRCTSELTYVVQNNDTNLYKDTFVTSFAEIPGLVFSAILVEWFGRKASMWFMLFTCCAFLGPLVLQQKEFLTTILLFGARAFSMGSFTVLCLYAQEAYPTSVSECWNCHRGWQNWWGCLPSCCRQYAAKLSSDGGHHCF